MLTKQDLLDLIATQRTLSEEYCALHARMVDLVELDASTESNTNDTAKVRMLTSLVLIDNNSSKRKFNTELARELNNYEESLKRKIAKNAEKHTA